MVIEHVVFFVVLNIDGVIGGYHIILTSFVVSPFDLIQDSDSTIGCEVIVGMNVNGKHKDISGWFVFHWDKFGITDVPLVIANDIEHTKVIIDHRIGIV